VRWSPPPWLRKGDAQRTPDLSSVVQHVVDEPGWNEGDALALLTWGTGKRTVGASDAGASTLLYVEYDAGVLDVELPCRLFP
jgi:hypothetical protein